MDEGASAMGKKVIPRVFIGYDKRAPLAYTILQHSIVTHASGPVSITPLIIDNLKGFNRVGLTQFTYSRYLPPYLCDFEGVSLFMDSDMIVLGDVYELFKQAASGKSVYVVDSELVFERPSVMLFNNDRCKQLTRGYVNNPENKLQRFAWASDGIGHLPKEWNHLVGYDKPNPNPKLIHYTMGIPEFAECREHEHSGTWRTERDKALKLPSWIELMGLSVHRQKVLMGLNIGKAAS